jgi:uncharacterized membrane protein
MNARKAHPLSEKRFESLIGTILRSGVILAAIVVLAGGTLYLAKYGNLKPDYRIFRGEPTDLQSVSGIFHDALRHHSRGLIQVGLLILISTPIARVAFCVAAFLAERDWLYVLTTLIVLGILLYSLASA